MPFDRRNGTSHIRINVSYIGIPEIERTPILIPRLEKGKEGKADRKEGKLYIYIYIYTLYEANLLFPSPLSSSTGG